jgi:glycosyltransferase involved in cell wall biosynthesis
VVVDDGSRDAAAVAAEVAGAPHARLVTGGGRGPAAARNLGAAAARAAVLCFTDDDCRPGPGWLDALARRIEAGAAAVAGPTRNGLPGDVYASASQAITNHLVEASLDPAAGRVGFAPTSNVACRAELHRSLPFDEGYPLAAGEDRDWCARLAEAGSAPSFEPRAWVAHHQDLSLRGFWGQQVRYGRGAYRCHRGPGPRRARLQPPRFYAGLVRTGFAGGVCTGLLVVLAQVATVVGATSEALATRRRAAAGRPAATEALAARRQARSRR